MICYAKGRIRSLTATSLLASSLASCVTKIICNAFAQNVCFAELRNFSARMISEVSVMITRTLTKQERVVAAIVEQTLEAMIETKLTVEKIMDAAAESAQRSRS